MDLPQQIGSKILDMLSLLPYFNDCLIRDFLRGLGYHFHFLKREDVQNVIALPEG